MTHRWVTTADGQPISKPLSLRTKFSWMGQLRKRLPIVGWLPQYGKEEAVPDAIAGCTAGLTMIAQAIAYATLAELPSQYGLYSAFAGSLIYVFFGTVKEVSIGPTSLNALLTLQYTMGKPRQYTIVLAFLSGCVQLLMGVFQLGFIVDFISVPVTTAFTSASALIIVSAQMKNFFGLRYSSKRFVDSLYELFVRIGAFNPADVWLAIGCCCSLFAIKVIAGTKWSSVRLRSTLWYLNISSNVIVVVITSVLAYNYPPNTVPFRLSGEVEPGLPAFNVPPLQFEHNNQTVEFLTICSDLGSGLVVVPLVAVLANVAIAKAFAVGCSVDTTQEMMTLGLCNIFGSFFGSMPTGGAFTRSAVIRASGVRTPFVGIYSASIVLLALSVLTPYFYYIPTATLASVLVVAVISLINLKLPLELWRRNRPDFWPWLGTFTVCLAFGVEVGLFTGILLSLSHLIYMWARPKIQRTVDQQTEASRKYIRLDLLNGLFYPSADYLRQRANEAAAACQHQLPLVIDCSRFNGLDYTSAQSLRNLAADLTVHNQLLILVGLPEHMRAFPVALPANVVFVDDDSGVYELLQTSSGSTNHSRIQIN